MALQDPNIMPSSRLDCPLSLKTPNMGNTGYYIISGRGSIRVGDEDSPVQPGTTVFVGANVEHHFHSIAEDLSILVVFAPPSGSLAQCRADLQT